MWTGTVKKTFHGHYESVNCCHFSSLDQVTLTIIFINDALLINYMLTVGLI